MLKKRIIPCLDIQDGRAVKGTNFRGITDAGDPVRLAKQYADQGADELVVLDITASIENRKTFTRLIELIAASINIPFTVGGGIGSVEDVRRLTCAGADKISINSAAVRRPELIVEIAQEFGSQCVVVAIDTRQFEGKSTVYTHGGQRPTQLNTLAWAQKAVELGAGEILLTSIDQDGTKTGFDLDITNRVSRVINVPVIASGGAGQMLHFQQLFENTEATAALAAGIFHYGEMNIPDLKQYLRNNQIEIRWT